jgi:hypothetical protein
MKTKEKLEIFKSLFRGRTDCYGAENATQKKPLTDNTMIRHLSGQRRIGVYMVLTDSVYFACADIDRKDRESVAVEDTKAYIDVCGQYGIGGYIEKSKSKGYHIWIFFSDLVKASKIIATLEQIYTDTGIKEPIEIFPKQDYVCVDEGYGNYINLPLFKADLADGKTAFIDPLRWTPYPDQWQFLSEIKKINPKEIDDIMEINNIAIIPEPEPEQKQNKKIFKVEAGPEGDINKVVDGCLFMKHCIDNAETLSEPLWYAMICNLATFPGGNSKIHEYSESYPRYTYEETQEKIEHALKDAPGPTTCQQIKELGFSCDKVCNVKAPAGRAYKFYVAGIEAFPQTDQKLFNSYLGLFNGVTEAPDSYHFFNLAVALGMMLNRHVYLSYPHEVYSNLYVILVGRSGHDRKDTAIRFGRRITQQLCKAQILPSINSYEGLIQAMIKPELALASDDSQYNHVLVTLSEFNSLLKKARNDSISNLIPQLCELYDTPSEARLLTRGNPVKVENPFFSIISGIQPSILQKAFQSGDIDSGFSGRFLYVYDRAKDPIPFPESINQEQLHSVINEAKKYMDNLIKISSGKTTKMELTPDAKKLWIDFYNWHRDSNKDSELLCTLTVRIPEQVLKLAMIFSAVGGYFHIEEYCLLDAIKVCKWCMKNTETLFEGYGQTKIEKTEAYIQRMLKNESLTRRRLQQSSNVDAETFGKAIDNLLKAELVEDIKEGRKKLLKLTED